MTCTRRSVRLAVLVPLLLVAAAFALTFASCGTAEEPAPLVSDLTASGCYACGGETWCVDENLTSVIGRRAAGLSNVYKVNLGASTGAGPANGNTPYNRVSFLCGEYSIPTSPACGVNGRLCATSGATCQMLSRRANTATWLFSGWLDGAPLSYWPTLSANGTWELLGGHHYVSTPSWNGNGDGMCPGVHLTAPSAAPPLQYWDFN